MVYYMSMWLHVERGGALVMTLVILAVFLVMMVATAALISRQFKQIVGQEQEEQAFQIAEAGVSYGVWLLDNNLVDYKNPQGITDYVVIDETKEPSEVLGTFDLTFETLNFAEPDGPLAVRVKSVGKDAVLVQRKQTIEAVIHSSDLDDFQVIEWDHKPYLD